MNNFLGYTFWGNPVRNWLIAVGCILVLFLFIRLFKNLLLKKMHAVAARTASTLDDLFVAVLEKTLVPVAYLFSIYGGIKILDTNARADKIIDGAAMVVLTWGVVRLATSMLGFSFRRYMLRQPGETREKQGRGILMIFNILLWIVGFVFLIDNFGYNITTIITGLGVGGIAIALAAQAILGDLFSYLVIFFDKPFEIGDFIIVDDKMGSIEYIGIKTTRIRTLSGEQLICSNSKLTGSWVHNYKRMDLRRIVFSFGIIIHTPVEKVKLIGGWIKDIVQAQEKVRFDRAHFLKFGESSLDFEVVYYVLDADYNLYMDIQQAINLGIMERFEKEGVSFAFPARTIFMQKPDQLSLHRENRSEDAHHN
ncbi:MAG TPA: mechanosensitive ion channel family protein [Puia sp.]|uniref:mechanosensitive ion channel family protein n=1 Tax=Puia sp. TaxID=2045100 RepID=UPI002CF436B8|nr:mechanosensitive ion channel family protein [Puia sp.]HVU94260.1 mechanosensitive ion channel family protein [Puia sp.]